MPTIFCITCAIQYQENTKGIFYVFDICCILSSKYLPLWKEIIPPSPNIIWIHMFLRGGGVNCRLSHQIPLPTWDTYKLRQIYQCIIWQVLAYRVINVVINVLLYMDEKCSQRERLCSVAFPVEIHTPRIWEDMETGCHRLNIVINVLLYVLMGRHEDR